MAQVINVLGYGDISFPDGMSMEEITEALKQLPPAPAPRSMPDEMMRQAGLVCWAARPGRWQIASACCAVPVPVERHPGTR